MEYSNIPDELNKLSNEIIGLAIKVHRALGPGLLESVYEITLAHELQKRRLTVERQVPIPIVYDDLRFDEGFRADLIVNDSVCEQSQF